MVSDEGVKPQIFRVSAPPHSKTTACRARSEATVYKLQNAAFRPSWRRGRPDTTARLTPGGADPDRRIRVSDPGVSGGSLSGRRLLVVELPAEAVERVPAALAVLAGEGD